MVCIVLQAHAFKVWALAAAASYFKAALCLYLCRTLRSLQNVDLCVMHMSYVFL